MATPDYKHSPCEDTGASEPATPSQIPSPDSYSAFIRSKREEWSAKCSYPRADKINQLLSCQAATEAMRNSYCCFSSQQQSDFTETLKLLGWNSIDASDSKALDKLELTHGSLLLAGPEVAAALRQREDQSRFACSLTYWEQKLHCLETYWMLYETLKSFEQSLQMFSRMGLLGDTEESSERARRISYRDILLPTVHLGEVWGRKLSLFLKAHDCFRVKRASGPASTTRSGSDSAICCQAANTTVSNANDLVYQPAVSENSGRKRLEVLTEKLNEHYRCGEDSGPVAWSGLILQAQPETHQMLGPDREFTLETFLLLAPRRNPVTCGFAAFFHPGLVRVNASAVSDNRSPSCPPGADGCGAGQIFAWIPDQLSDYLAAVEPDRPDWLKCIAYPQLEAASAYLATALSQQLLDSVLSRFYLLRLSFLVDAKRRQPRLADLSQHVTSQSSPDSDYCESLVLPRLLQEAALIVAELLVRSSQEPGLPARSLVTPHNMKLVHDSAEPSVQRNVLSRAASLSHFN